MRKLPRFLTVSDYWVRGLPASQCADDMGVAIEAVLFKYSQLQRRLDALRA